MMELKTQKILIKRNRIKSCIIWILGLTAITCCFSTSLCYAKPAQKPPPTIVGVWQGNLIIKRVVIPFLLPAQENNEERSVTVRIVKTGNTARFNFVGVNPPSFTRLTLRGDRKGSHKGETVSDCIYSGSIYVEALSRKKLYFSTSTSASECQSLVDTYFSGAATLTRIK